MSDSDLITPEEALDILGLKARNSLYNLEQRDLLHPVHSKYGKGRGGRRVYYKRSEVEALATPAGAEQRHARKQRPESE